MKQITTNNWDVHRYGQDFLILYHKKKPLKLTLDLRTNIGRFYAVELEGGKTITKKIKREHITIINR